MAKKLGRLLHLWGPVAGVLAVLFYYSSQSHWNGYLGEMASRIGTKPFHVLAYLMLALTLLRACHQGRWPLKRGQALGALAVFAGVSISDEWYQLSIPDRPHYHTFASDVLLDGLCFVVAVVLWQSVLWGWARWHNALRRTRRRRNTSLS